MFQLQTICHIYQIIKWRRQNISQFISFFPSRSAMEMRQTLEERRCARRGDAEKPSYEEMHRTLDALWPFRNYTPFVYLHSHDLVVCICVFLFCTFWSMNLWLMQATCGNHTERSRAEGHKILLCSVNKLLHLESFCVCVSVCVSVFVFQIVEFVATYDVASNHIISLNIICIGVCLCYRFVCLCLNEYPHVSMCCGRLWNPAHVEIISARPAHP